MGITNRANNASQQRVPLNFIDNVGLTSGQTGVLAYVPFPCVLNAAQVAAFSIASAPNLLLTVSRFIVGAGVTTWNLGSTFLPNSFGTSGVLGSGISLPASGSTLNILTANDVLGFVVGGGSTAAIYGLAGCFVVEPIQDSRVFLGLV